MVWNPDIKFTKGSNCLIARALRLTEEAEFAEKPLSACVQPQSGLTCQSCPLLH